MTRWFNRTEYGFRQQCGKSSLSLARETGIRFLPGSRPLGMDSRVSIRRRSFWICRLSAQRSRLAVRAGSTDMAVKKPVDSGGGALCQIVLLAGWWGRYDHDRPVYQFHWTKDSYAPRLLELYGLPSPHVAGCGDCRDEAAVARRSLFPVYMPRY